MNKKIKIALVGLPGSGKSTLGRQLAKRLQVDFLDTDVVIEKRLGCSIRRYFDLEGEAAFRTIETTVLDELTQHYKGVLSTGGGSVLSPINRSHLRKRMSVVYLRAQPTELFQRLRHDTQRPLLQVDDPLQRLQTLYNERHGLYTDCADCVLDTGSPSVGSLVSSVVQELTLKGFL